MKQKRLVALYAVLFVLLFSGTSYSQGFGFKAGYNLSNLGGLTNQANVKDAKSLSGYHAGLFGQVKIAIITLQLDAVYSTQGATVIDASNAETKYENNYVNLPLVAKVNLGPIFVLGGLQYGILTSSKINGVKDDNGVFFEKSDLAIPLGVGINIKKVTVEGRYNLGISNVNNLAVSDDDNLVNAVFQLSAGLRFGK
jgi:hypothetical protein